MTGGSAVSSQTPVPIRLRQALADRYVLSGEIGRGGMAAVYRATDLRHDREVAVKVLRPELAAIEGVPERFLREIRIAARLTHPNILPVHDSGEQDGFLFFVMPYLGCESLRDRISRDGQLPIEQAMRITAAVASALDYAHRQQIVHRDVKPENIMLIEGHPVVADFGIARALSDTGSARLTLMGMVMGTPAYMSPEQAAGEEVDGRSDQYSLACVAYEMVVGHPPFPGGTAHATLARQLAEAPAPMLPSRATVPPAVEWAIMKALAKRPDARFATATEFAEALTRAAPIPSASLATSVRDVRAIAVLPFVNASPDPEDEYLSDGLTEELINALAQVEGLHVAPRTAVFAKKGKVTDVRDVGATLGVTFVLEGVVRRSGQRLRITAQLTNALDGRMLWSSRFDHDAQEVFTVQEEIARTIVITLRGTLLGDLGDPLPQRATRNPKAFHLYLRGRHAWASRQGRDGVQEAIRYFEQAIAEDPSYALAYTGLSDSYALLLDYRGVPVQDGMERAKAEARRALALDDSLPEAHTSLGWVVFIYDWDWPEAEREFRRAIELDPRYATARQWYAWLLMALGRVEESLMQARLAVELDPASVAIRRSLGWLYGMARQPEAAIAYLRRTLALDPTSEETLRVLGLNYLQKGLLEDAEHAFEEALAMAPETAYAMAGLAATHARAGRKSEVERLLAELDEIARNRYVSPVAYAMIHSVRGDADQTFDWLERAWQERRGWLTYLKVEPMLDPIRGDPRFGEWLKRMKLE